ncbi:MAG: glutamine-hydrolyzing GMP synthase [Bdellovibrionales bacterium]|nr:glutamine-hydrolyzing GMP synthase [Bdellovibrionales bacterium]
MIVVIDFGSQTTQLIARRIREMGVYCEIHPFDAKPQEITQSIEGLIFSGSPHSVYDKEAPAYPKAWVELEKPLLGICYGAQILTQGQGGKVEASDHREFGRAEIHIEGEDPLFAGVSNSSTVWMSHGDQVQSLPQGFSTLARSKTCPFAAFSNPGRRQWAVQFHPEVTHTDEGKKLLENFVLGICKATQNWSMGHFLSDQVEAIQKKVGDKQVLCGLSGGVDSSVVASLLHRAIGSQLKAVFVDTGLLRKGEVEEVRQAFESLGNFPLYVVDAKARFYEALAGVSDPEKKRKIIGKTFIEVFEEKAQTFENIEFLAQGTLYPDVIESVSTRGPSSTIKTHHNVGGLPEHMKLTLIEPLRELFKDEVRALGRELGLPKFLVGRHPFPGPGLAVRILGEVTKEKVEVLGQADAIFIEELKSHDLYDQVWQALTVLLPVQSVGVMGDGRTYENACVIRAVTSHDGMTADWAHLPHEFLAKVSNRIINEVRGINRVVYDISSKPPATIEWE